MSQDDDIHIQKAIVHKVDHKQYDQPLLSDLELPLNDAVRSYLRRHIAANREHKNSRTATFLDEIPEGACSFRGLCDDVLADPEQFVLRSREMAEHLYGHLAGNTSPGDLVISLFCEGGSDCWLAVLKMDPSDGFVERRAQVEGGWQISLEQVQAVLPGSEQPLQKCAFVLPTRLRKQRGYHVIVLDQQNRRYGVLDSVATFFSEGFLQARIALNPAEITQKFVNVSKSWLRRQSQKMPGEDRERAATELYHRIQSDRVDITDYALSVLPSPELQQEYLSELRQSGVEDWVFEPDPRQRKKLTQYTEFRGSGDLTLRLRSDEVGQMLSCCLDPGTGEYLVTIRTTEWELVRGEVDPCQGCKPCN